LRLISDAESKLAPSCAVIAQFCGIVPNPAESGELSGGGTNFTDILPIW
jgi:hypothetical protein